MDAYANNPSGHTDSEAAAEVEAATRDLEASFVAALQESDTTSEAMQDGARNVAPDAGEVVSWRDRVRRHPRQISAAGLLLAVAALILTARRKR